jgi:hypothetical protein
MRLLTRAKATGETAFEILLIDQYICGRAEEFHIPYWSPVSKAADAFKNTIMQSRFGRYATNFEPIKTPGGVIRGVRVFYAVNGVACHTDALFPSVSVMERLN